MECDFCSSEPVTARYHADSFEIEAFSKDTLHQLSVGDWAACADCAQLIDTNDWDSLIHRVCAFFYEKNPKATEFVPFRALETQLRQTYAQLRDHNLRKGKFETE